MTTHTSHHKLLLLASLAASALSGVPATARAIDVPDPGLPDAVIDLRTDEGVRAVRGQWRHRPARIVEVDHREPGPDLKPTGKPNRTHDIEPRAGGVDFDDSGWESVAPASLEDRRAGGRLCFNWYRLRVTVPDKVARFDTRGATVILEIVVDDYAEVWVDGRLPLVLGQAGGALVGGWNAPNRVVVARDARPGQQIQLAVFGANAPLSEPPGNYIWIRSATLDFYRAKRWPPATEVSTEVVRHDAALDRIVPAAAKMEKLAGGFEFLEGPV